MSTHPPAHRRHRLRLFRPQPLLLTAAIAAATASTGPAPAAEPPAPPPPPPQAPAPMNDVAPVETIFTYQLDGRCRIHRTRKLQGPDAIRWRDAEQALGITRQETVFRYVEGQRTQLRERRVKLLGEMVREGVLVCHVRPSGEVVEAWIERRDTSAARRQALRREDLPIRNGRIPDLGTYSVSFRP